MKHVLVTGGTGVTGNALIRYLLQHNIAVTALVRPGSFRRKYLPQNNGLLTIVDCAMDDYKNILPKLHVNKYDVFFHLSWDGSTGKKKIGNRNNFSLQNQNVGYALDAVELCHNLQCPVFVMTGSQAEYGRINMPIKETMEKKPENGYGMAKLCAEGMTRLLCKEYGIRHIWPILFSVYGPYDATESLIDTTIRKLVLGETLAYTKGEQRWDYLYSYDAASALVQLAEKGQAGEVYHVANGRSIPLAEYIQTIYEVLGWKLIPRMGELPYGEKQIMYLGADISKLQRTTGFKSEYSFREGVIQIVESIQNEKNL